MECLEFKRLALSDPNCKDVSFTKHAKDCPCCLKYIGGVREMDANLVSSLDVEVPDDFMARLELNQILDNSNKANYRYDFQQYAKVACLALVMFVSGFFIKDAFIDANNNESFSSYTEISQATEGMVVNIVSHMEQNPMNPVWEAGKANKTMKTLMASYDPNLKLKKMGRLQFTTICALDKKRNMLHANLDTDHGQTTFAYVKDHLVGEVSNTSYKGFLTRVKPVRGGSLVIISNNMYAMEEADAELESAMYWDL